MAEIQISEELFAKLQLRGAPYGLSVSQVLEAVAGLPEDKQLTWDERRANLDRIMASKRDQAQQCRAPS